MTDGAKVLVDMVTKIMDEKVTVLNNANVVNYSNLTLDIKTLDAKIDSVLQLLTSGKPKAIRTKAATEEGAAAAEPAVVTVGTVRAKNAVMWFKDQYTDTGAVGTAFRAKYTVAGMLDQIKAMPDIIKKKENQRDKAIAEKMHNYIKDNDKILHTQLVAEHEEYKKSVKAPKVVTQAQVDPGSP
jgi:hypothetical protein